MSIGNAGTTIVATTTTTTATATITCKILCIHIHGCISSCLKIAEEALVTIQADKVEAKRLLLIEMKKQRQEEKKRAVKAKRYAAQANKHSLSQAEQMRIIR